MAKDCVIELPTFHEKQLQVWESEATEILFAGDTRAGKSYFIRRALTVWCSLIPGLQCDIFRLNFDDVIGENMEGETSFPVLLAPWRQAGLCKINQTEVIFWNESRISLEHCSDDTVMEKHRGIAKHVRVFSESTQILEHRIRALTGWVTMSEEMQARVPDEWKGRFPKVFHITNPKGISVGYYRRNFVDARPPYSIEKVGPFMRQYIPAFLDDNPSEDQQKTRERIAEAFPDPETQKALINVDKTGISNWHTGIGEFFTEFGDQHVVQDFIPPQHWMRFRSFDWGVADPAVCYWVAVSDGEVFRDSEGHERWFPRGALIFYNEWYICDAKDPSKGARMRNEDMALGIISRSEMIARNCVTLTDSKPFQDDGGEGIAGTFAKNGLILSRADTSRVAGWSQMRARLIGVEYNGEKLPMIYFCECCRYARDYISALPRHPREGKREDAAEHGEATHACDAIRYACMAHSVIKDRKEPTEARIQRQLERYKPTIKNITKRMGHDYFR